MTAALTLLIILAVSLLVVRIGGTALRLTGMSMDAARFQSISALTGTGFTTQEAETTMHHPIRRKVLIGLMFVGHLGVVSLASAVILGISTANDGSIPLTIFYMVLAVIVICVIAMNDQFDAVVCAGIGAVFKRLGWFEDTQYHVVMERPDGTQVAEHLAHRTCTIDATTLGVNILQLNDEIQNTDVTQLNPGDRVLCFGAPAAHRALNALAVPK